MHLLLCAAIRHNWTRDLGHAYSMRLLPKREAEKYRQLNCLCKLAGVDLDVHRLVDKLPTISDSIRICLPLNDECYFVVDYNSWQSASKNSHCVLRGDRTAGSRCNPGCDSL